jgi:large subunit ribosomal protein L16
VGLAALEAGEFTQAQLDECRRRVGKALPKTARQWIRVAPSQKPGAHVDPSQRRYRAEANEVITEIDGVPLTTGRQVLEAAASALPLRTRVVVRTDLEP